ncbi:MAG: 6-carboxytetrahydropterin synthase QueD, partial [Deltaproteobacteria bacterium]|nr:6-carboxytetrahydropterin synthase QueD [Deltaproteobacteria bacterium]
LAALLPVDKGVRVTSVTAWESENASATYVPE